MCYLTLIKTLYNNELQGYKLKVKNFFIWQYLCIKRSAQPIGKCKHLRNQVLCNMFWCFTAYIYAKCDEWLCRRKWLNVRELQEQYFELTNINIRGTKMQNMVWFILSKPNECVIIIYQSTPSPPYRSAAVGRSHLMQIFFSFFNSFCQECLLFFCIAYLFKYLCLRLVRIIYFMVLPLLLEVWNVYLSSTFWMLIMYKYTA